MFACDPVILIVFCSLDCFFRTFNVKVCKNVPWLYIFNGYLSYTQKQWIINSSMHHSTKGVNLESNRWNCSLEVIVKMSHLVYGFCSALCWWPQQMLWSLVSQILINNTFLVLTLESETFFCGKIVMLKVKIENTSHCNFEKSL